MEWLKWGADLLAAGLCGLAGGTMGGYTKSFWQEKGKNVATYQDREFLLAKERGTAYEQETGKRLATHEDIENVLSEVRSVTKETETIKAQISGELWTQQMVWNQKRDVYAGLMELISKWTNLCFAIKGANEGRQFTAEVETLKATLNRCTEELIRHYSLAQVFAGEEACGAISTFLQTVGNGVKQGNWADLNIAGLERLKNSLVSAAQSDLGVRETVSVERRKAQGNGS